MTRYSTLGRVRALIIVFSVCLATPMLLFADVKIGLLLMLSGKQASAGERELQGATLAREMLAEQGIANVELTVEDTQASGKRGIDAFLKLKTQGVRMFVSQGSVVSMPLLPLARQAEVLLIGAPTTADAFSTPNDTVLRMNGTSKEEARAMVELIRSLVPASPSVVLAVMEDEYAESLGANVEALLTKANITFASESYAPSESDFRTLISKLSARDPNVVICLGFGGPCGLFAKHLRASKLANVPLVSNAATNSIELIDAGGVGVEGSYITSIAADPQHPAYARFLDRHGYAPDVFSGGGFDAVWLIGEGVRACGERTSPRCVSEFIHQRRNYSGLLGKKDFDAVTGDTTDYYRVLRVRGGAFVADDRVADALRK